MAIELPKFSLCCFCIPMRPGLISWATFLMLTQTIMLMVIASQVYGAPSGPGKNIIISLLAVMVLDIIFGGVLLISVLQVHNRLFMFYYYYSILSLLTHMILVIIYMFLLIFIVPTYSNLPKGQFWEAVLNFGGRGLLEILMKLYMVLIVKSVLAEQRSSQPNQQLPQGKV